MRPFLYSAALMLFSTFFGVATAQNFTSVSWTTVASQPYPVYEAQGEVVRGKLYTFGGFDNQKIAQFGYWTPTNRAFVYDPLLNNWTPIAPMPPMNGTTYGGVTHAGFTTDSADIYFAGGYTSNSTGTGQIFGTREVWKYIVQENRYVRLPNLPRSLASGQLEYINNRLHHIGGFPGNPNSTVEVPDHYVLDLRNPTGGWQTLAPIPVPRNHMGSTVLSGKIYIVGGQHGNDDHSMTLRDGFAYDPVTNAWNRIADMPVPSGTTGRAHISSSVLVLGSRFIVVGGETSHNVRTNLVSAYSPATNTWQNLTAFPRSIAGGVGCAINGIIYYSGGPSLAATYKGTPAQSTTVLPSADSYVRNGTFANVNYGKDTALQVKGSGAAGYTRYSYLKFSLGTIPNIFSAKLRLYGRNNENTSNIIISAFGVTNDSWTETAITFNNAPPAGTAALGSVGVNNIGKYYEIDVTSFVKTQLAGDKVVSILVRDATNQNRFVSFSSREKATNKPQLVLMTPLSGTAQVQSLQVLEDNRQQAPLSIYPNPAKNGVNVEVPGALPGVCTIQVLDASGRQAGTTQKVINEGKSSFSLDLTQFALQKGIYWLRISQKEKTWTGAMLME